MTDPVSRIGGPLAKHPHLVLAGGQFCDNYRAGSASHGRMISAMRSADVPGGKNPR